MGNTVGSRESYIAFKARKSQVLWVTSRQLEILQGSILGDAYVSPLGKIQIEQSVHQVLYLQWKYQELASVSYRSTPTRVQRKDKRTNKVYESFRFWTRQYFRPLRHQFYKEKKKKFPSNLKLTPLLLAVWYMDDGHYERNKDRCILATDNFCREDIQKIQKLLLNDYSIHATIRKSGKLVMSGKDQIRFFNLIGSHVVPIMQYKIR